MTLWRARGWFCRLLNTAWPVYTPDLCATAFSQESFSRQNEASVERPGGFKMFLGPLGTFFNRFGSRKTSNSWNYVKNCPLGLNFRSQNFRHQSNSLIYFNLLKTFLTENYWTDSYDIWTIDSQTTGVYSIRKWG